MIGYILFCMLGVAIFFYYETSKSKTEDKIQKAFEDGIDQGMKIAYSKVKEKSMYHKCYNCDEFLKLMEDAYDN